jgi:hypothetical protein
LRLIERGVARLPFSFGVNMDYLKDVLDEYLENIYTGKKEPKPLVIPIGQQAKESRAIRECLDKQKQLQLEENKSKEELEALLARFGELTAELAEAKKKIDIDNNTEHRRLEID